MSHTNPLPELPRPFVPGDEFNPRNYYTADQMREYAAAAYDLGARSTAPVSEREAALLSACESAISWLEGWASAEPYISILRNAVAGARSTAAQPVEPTGRIAALEARTGMCTLEEAPSWHPGEWLCIRFNTPEERMAAWRAINGQNVDVPQCPAASGDSTPPSEPACEICKGVGMIGGFVNADSGYDGMPCPECSPKGDPSGALRPEPEAVGQGRWWRKKPVVIEAFQWNGLESGCQAAKARFPELETSSKSGHLRRPEVTSWHIRTLEGHMRVSPGDWIVRGVAGEFYPCKPDIFAATYEPAEPPQAASVERGD